MKLNFPERKRIRLSEYDYSSDGDYFVTICTKDRQNFFGEIRNGIMGLNDFGCIVAKCWQEIPKHFEYVKLDDWQIMPNHIHGVLNIETPETRHPVGDAYMRPAPTLDDWCDINYCQSWDANLRPLRGNDRTKMLLSKIIHGFKSTVTRRINRIQNKIFFQWQRSYYDHIIRDAKSLNDICEYIQNNPYNWTLDLENREKRYSEIEIKNHYNHLFNKYSV